MAEYTWPWEQDAQAGREMPQGLSLADQMAYTAMRNIYAAYHRRQLSRESAAAEKRKVWRAYEQAKEAEAFDKKCSQYTVRLRRDTELAASAYRKNRTLANADRLADVLDGIMRPEVADGQA